MTRKPKSYWQSSGDIPLLQRTIPTHFAEIAARFPDREAVVSIPQNRRLSYRQLARAVEQLALGLLGLGFGKGDRIGIWSTNNLEWLFLQMAIARIGAILVNINPAYRVGELAYALERSEVQGVFVIPAFKSSRYLEMLQELLPELEQERQGPLECKKLPFLRYVVVYEPQNPAKTRRPAPGFTIWPEVIAAGTKIKAAELFSIC